MAQETTTIGPIYSILRIKRKRNDNSVQPLQALLIDNAEPSTRKRRRVNDINSSSTPTDAAQLAQEQLSQRGIFRFAETVPLDTFDTPTKTRAVRDRIQAFLSHPPPSIASASSSRPTSALSTPPPGTPPIPSGTPTYRKPSSFPFPPSSTATSTPEKEKLTHRVAGFHEGNKRARYRVVERRRDLSSYLGEGEIDEEESSAANVPKEREWNEFRDGQRPPEVLSASEVLRKSQARSLISISAHVTIYDAVEEGNLSSGFTTPGKKQANLLSNGTGNGPKEDVMMTNFETMLEEYLTLQSRDAPSLPTPTPANPTPLVQPPPAQEPEGEESDEFVYDLYYRDLRPEVSSSLSNLGVGMAGGMDVNSLEGLKMIGELAGLDQDEILDDGDISEDEEDEADQDSNEENDYRNDYPDGEDDDDSDSMFDDGGGGESDGYGSE